MKKYLKYLFVFLFSFIIMSSTMAEETKGEEFWLPYNNRYYQRSQHTYEFVEKSGTPHNDIAPAIYTIITDEEKANGDTFKFADYYNVPWSVNESNYFLVYCADVDINIVRGTKYKRISLKDYEKFSNEEKEGIVGVLKNSYPYITVDEMIENLVKAGVLEKKEVNYKTIYVAKDNDEATMSITSDELLSATQLAIHNFTNHGQITNVYYRTAQLQTDTITKQSSLWTNIYPSGNHEAVEKNIKAVYEYLITLKDTSISKEISTIEVEQKNDKSFTLYIKLNTEVNDKDDLKIIVNEDLLKRAELNLKEAKINKDGFYVLDVNVPFDKEKINVKLTGNEYNSAIIDAYEAVDGIEASQTLVGLTSGFRNVDNKFSGIMGNHVLNDSDSQNDGINKNPNTSDYIFIVALIGFMSLGTIIYFKKKSF